MLEQTHNDINISGASTTPHSGVGTGGAWPPQQ